MTSRSRSLSALVLVAALGVAGCSEGVDQIDDPVESSTVPSSSATSAPAPSAPAPSVSATTGDGARGRLTSSEIEVDEVRDGCVYVTTPGGERWALRGGDVEVGPLGCGCPTWSPGRN